MQKKLYLPFFISSAIPVLAGKGNSIKLLRLWHFATVKCRVEIRNSLSRRRQIKLKIQNSSIPTAAGKNTASGSNIPSQLRQNFRTLCRKDGMATFFTGWRENSFFPSVLFFFCGVMNKRNQKINQNEIIPTSLLTFRPFLVSLSAQMLKCLILFNKN